MTIHRTFARRFSQIMAAAAGLLLALNAAHAAETVTYYHTDALGTPVMESNAAGTVTYVREHKPYGEQALGAAKHGPGFTGHVGDADTGLTYMQARYYDPVAERFLSSDPVLANINTGGNYNRYWYANNNPYAFTDPDGMQAKNETPCETMECNRSRQEERRQRSDEPFTGGRVRAPTEKLAKWMTSSDPKDRLKAAQAARIFFKIGSKSRTRLGVTTRSGDGTSGARYVNGEIWLWSEAFSSWSWLGSVLSHEYEGHEDEFDNSPRGLAASEFKAWQHSLDSVKRFKNTPGEIRTIERTLEYWKNRYKFLSEETSE